MKEFLQTILLSHRPSEPAYYIVDWRIFDHWVISLSVWQQWCFLTSKWSDFFTLVHMYTLLQPYYYSFIWPVFKNRLIFSPDTFFYLKDYAYFILLFNVFLFPKLLQIQQCSMAKIVVCAELGSIHKQCLWLWVSHTV